jgi:hypothetical protein
MFFSLGGDYRDHMNCSEGSGKQEKSTLANVWRPTRRSEETQCLENSIAAVARSFYCEPSYLETAGRQ